MRDEGKTKEQLMDELIELRRRTAELEASKVQYERKAKTLDDECSLLHMLIDNLPDVIFFKDVKGRFVIANKALLESFKAKTQEEVIGKTDFDFMPKELAEKYFAEEEDIYHTGQPMISQEHSVVHPAGEKTWALSSKVLFKDSQGKVLGIAGVNHDITELKRMEETLRGSEEFNFALFQYNPIETIVVDLEGRVIRSNLAKKESGDVLPDTGDIMYRDCAGEYEIDMYAELMECVTSGKTKSFPELKYDGKFLSVKITPFPKGAIITSQNVTDLRRAGEELQRKTRQQEQLLNTARHLTASLDLKEVLTRIGTGAKEILKAYGCAIYLLKSDGKTLIPVVSIEPSYEKEILSTPLNVETSFTGQAVKARRGLIFNDAGFDFSGQQIPGTPLDEDERVITAPFIVEDKVLGAMCLNRIGTLFSEEDLSLAETFAAYAATALRNAQTYHNLQREVEERKRIRKALRESEERYRTLFEKTANPILIIDSKGNYIDCNEAALKFVESTRDELLTKNVRDFIPPDAEWKAFEEQRSLWNSGGTVEAKYYVHGHIKILELTVTPAIWRGGRVVFGIGKDITERKRLEEKLLHAQKMEAVGRLAGGVAHDFNNLLTVINGYAELARPKLHKGDPLYNYIETIRKSGRKATNLTRQLLAFSRHQMIKPRIIDLNSVILDMDKMLRRLIGEDIELVVLPGENLGSVEADPGQVEQVLVNLIVNSRDAMPDGGKIVIETTEIDLKETYSSAYDTVKPGRYLVISVRDTGIGMSDEVKSHIFEPFFTTKEIGKGTGLGLATVYGIVKQSNGHIFFESEEDKGTTFKIYLPRLDKAAKVSLDRFDEGYLPRGDETILLVEDEHSVREFVNQILEDHGYTVLKASGGGEALNIAEKHDGTIHLLLTDIVMPKMGGQQLTEILKVSRPEIKVLYISGYTDDVVIRQRITDLKTAFLQKPFTVSSLIRKAREVLDRQP